MNEITQVSVIDQTRIPLSMTMGSVARAWFSAFGGLLSAPFQQKIDLNMQPQCHSNWCWAAVAASVSAFYGKSSTYTQCTLADLQLGRHDCCNYTCHDPNVPDAVDKISTLASALVYTGCHTIEKKNERATRAQVQEEIRNSRPLCVRILWPDGVNTGDGPRNGAHYVTIAGYDPATDELTVADPLFPSPTVSFDRFGDNYLGWGGHWSHTIFTGP